MNKKLSDLVVGDTLYILQNFYDINSYVEEKIIKIEIIKSYKEDDDKLVKWFYTDNHVFGIYVEESLIKECSYNAFIISTNKNAIIDYCIDLTEQKINDNEHIIEKLNGQNNKLYQNINLLKRMKDEKE